MAVSKGPVNGDMAKIPVMGPTTPPPIRVESIGAANSLTRRLVGFRPKEGQTQEHSEINMRVVNTHLSDRRERTVSSFLGFAGSAN